LTAVTAFVARNAETLLASGAGVAVFAGVYGLGSTHAALTGEVSKLNVALAAERELREMDVATQRELREKEVATERALRACEKATLEAKLQAELELRATEVWMLSSAQTARGSWWPR
jgi:peroxiredoxin family protein